jgi:cob(I)alamin adenosyltransferase
MYGRRVSKTDSRVEAYGTVDELNTFIGLARSHSTLPLIQKELLAIQKHFVPLMGQLAVGVEDLSRYVADPKYAASQFSPQMLEQLDALVAQIESKQVNMNGWATPGSSPASAALDVARAVCRRAERLVVRLHESGGGDCTLLIQYLNRLSDVLWLMARYTETFQETPQ